MDNKYSYSDSDVEGSNMFSDGWVPISKISYQVWDHENNGKVHRDKVDITSDGPTMWSYRTCSSTASSKKMRLTVYDARGKKGGNADPDKVSVSGGNAVVAVTMWWPMTFGHVSVIKTETRPQDSDLEFFRESTRGRRRGGPWYSQ
jgi:hypothetical protein